MIALESRGEGIVLPVRAQAGARTSGIRGEQDGALKISVTQAPEKGKANKAIVAVISKELELRKSQIELISGASSTQKRFLIREVTREQLVERLESRL